MGLAPIEAQEGDQVCIVLGCTWPLLPRPASSDEWLVIEKCQVRSMMEGKALLGPLPSQIQRVEYHDVHSGGYWPAFLDHQRGEIQIGNPRLGPLPAGWRLMEHTLDHVVDFFENDEDKEPGTSFGYNPRWRQKAPGKGASN